MPGKCAVGNKVLMSQLTTTQTFRNGGDAVIVSSVVTTG